MANRRRQAARRDRDRKRELEELKRRQRARERRNTLIAIVVAIVVGGGLIAVAAVKPSFHTSAAELANKAGHQFKPTAAEKAAGCLGVHNDHPSKGSLHTPKAVDYTKYSKYSALPPSSGYHDPISLGIKTRFYDVTGKPRPERAVHLLEHGFVIIWYDAQLPAQQVQQLQVLAKDPTLPRLVVVGWWEGTLPQDKHVVLTSWGRTDRCSTVSNDAVRAFYTAHVDAPFAPEHGAGASAYADLVPPNELIPATQPSKSPTPTPSATKKK